MNNFTFGKIDIPDLPKPITDANDAAFGHGSENGHCCGLTKREYFAALILTGTSSNSAVNPTDAHHFAIDAVKTADALIDALNAPEVIR